LRANAIAFSYAAIGGVTNLASRLCDEARAGHIVLNRRVFGMVEPWVEGNSLEELHLKGFNHEVAAAEAPRRRQQPSRKFTG
jgi:class 3 adenylate cyclase